jgi:hypothetical protein
MSSKLSTIVLPTVVAIGLLAAMPVEVAKAYPVSCDVAFDNCNAQATTIQQHSFCLQQFEQCSGGAMPPYATDPLLAAMKEER